MAKKTTTNKRFVLSDETVNSYGFIVKTSGINLERFKNNPVLLYNHDPRNVIGKWTDIKIENGKLTAVPEFDESDEFALSIKKKVDNDYLRACSIGFHAPVFDHQKQPSEVVKTELIEVSITPIPSNQNALVFYDKENNVLSDSDVHKLAFNSSISLQAGIQKVFKTDSNDIYLLLEFVQNLQADFTALKSKVENEDKEKIEAVIRFNMANGKLNTGNKERYKEMLKLNFDLANEMIEQLPGKKVLIKLVKPSNTSLELKEDTTDWKLEDYRRKAPQLLNDKELYLELINKEFNQ